jgi:hypothetical protein
MQLLNSKYSIVLFCLFLFISLNSIGQQQVGSPTQKQGIPINPNRAVYTYSIITGSNNILGYDILKNGILVLHQPAEAPPDKSLSLKTEIQATRAAMFVIYKLKNNIQPAALTTGELKKVTIN